ncbi:unnamed protein product [Strongylus vulgaris]|uniref:Uncharacterized protein n=1 Tax=Strongylus vulgaris TaxID=40348 RepID=A0A3P7JH62_STRVU|nr:unnamed protein product [Strongylus vulgaris]
MLSAEHGSREGLCGTSFLLPCAAESLDCLQFRRSSGKADLLIADISYQSQYGMQSDPATVLSSSPADP